MWKRMILWSSVGGIAVGATVALSRRVRKPSPPPILPESIPPECRRVTLRTESFSLQEDQGSTMAHETYILQATSFRVWNVLELPAAGESGSASGVPIYHATVARQTDSNEVMALPETPMRFYGTVSVVDPVLGSDWTNSLARGALLELRKCYVGGARNGLETGDIHRSSAPILSYRFEYSD